MLFVGLCVPSTQAQTPALPFSEAFDSVAFPALPIGWVSSQARDPDGDFASTATGASSPPGAAMSSNATIEQSIITPALDLTDWRDVVIAWKERRSATHNSSLAVESSAGPGLPFVPLPGGTLGPLETTGYQNRSVKFPDPPEMPGSSGPVNFRMRIIGDGNGVTGTFRIDDILIDGVPRWDLAVTPPQTGPEPAGTGNPSVFTGVVRNTGFEATAMATISCLIKDASTENFTGWTFHSATTVASLLPRDSALYQFSIELPESGPMAILVVCETERDLVRSNDSAITVFSLPLPPHSVIINEIMYDPLPGRAEYVEILNRSSHDVDLGSWSLTDREDESTIGRFGEDAPTLGPGEFAVCSPDSSVLIDYPGIPPGTIVLGGLGGLSLNNMGDLLALRDGSGDVIDRLEYIPAWHTPVLDDPTGRSLEKIQAGSPGSESWNWGTSPDQSGGTPGRPNLLAAAAPPGRKLFDCFPNPFSPDGDGFEDVTNIRFSLGQSAALVRVRIFDSAGRPVRMLTPGMYVSGAGSIVWNGYDDDGLKAGIGVYVVLVEGIDASGDGSILAKGVVVVAGKL